MPPNCTFTSTIFNLTITSNGTNYDRLVLLFFDDTEIWRFSTAMPTRAGIYSTYQKDMTIYNALLTTPQKIILALDNIYDSVFTGAFNITIASHHYLSPSTLTPATKILPITTLSSPQNKSSVFSLPDDNASVPLIFPRNTKNAVVSILASGNGNEEFWYRKGVPTPYVNTFNNSQLHGFSPFREIQLLIDNQLAGVSWPFPIVFTGGINPGLWRPILGIDVYDVPSFEIDISPWLGVLCDGEKHSFGMRAVGYDGGAEDELGSVGENWWVTGSVFVWVDEGGNQTTGAPPSVLTPAPEFTFLPSLTSNSTANISLHISLSAQRSLSLTSTINTSTGPQTAIWTQDLSYLNIQNLTAAGYNNALSQLTSGKSTFTSGSNSFRYPIEAYTVSIPAVDIAKDLDYLLGSIDRSLHISGSNILPLLTGIESYPDTSTTTIPTLATRQNGTCIYYWNNTYYEFAGAIDPQPGSIGATDQWYSYVGFEDENFAAKGYGRILKARDGLDDYQGVVYDEVFEHGISVPETVAVVGEVL